MESCRYGILVRATTSFCCRVANFPAPAPAQAAQSLVATSAHDDHICPGNPQQFVWPYFGAAAISPNLSRALLGTTGPPKNACGRCLELQCIAPVGGPSAMTGRNPMTGRCYVPPAQATVIGLQQAASCGTPCKIR